jgi:hypothetical protein
MDPSHYETKTIQASYRSQVIEIDFSVEDQLDELRRKEHGEEVGTKQVEGGIGGRSPFDVRPVCGRQPNATKPGRKNVLGRQTAFDIPRDKPIFHVMRGEHKICLPADDGEEG